MLLSIIMMVRSMLVTATLYALVSQHVLAQVAPASGQQPPSESSVPIYRVTVVGRTTAAINYRRSGHTKVDLNGTALLPEARGVAEISPKNGHD